MLQGVVGLLLLSVAATTATDTGVSINLLRARAVTDPRGVVVDVRRQLDQAGAALAPARERALLWGMGTAAINANDDAALAESTLRLDGLAGAGNDAVAAAAAGFLRSRHDIANGISDGIGEALRAADKVLGLADPETVAWARFQLCDAYALGERADKALPLCRQAAASYAALDDAWGIADAQNDQGIALMTLGRDADAAEVYERARQRFARIGADALALMVGDNLASVYLRLGRVREAMALSKASLRRELADGRLSDALFSSANIAQAEAALGHRREAYARIRDIVARARAAGMNGQLPDLLQMKSQLAEHAGRLGEALADAREVIKLLGSTDTPALHATEVALEQRYAAREKELRIGELERQNRINSLQLRAAEAEAARREAAQQRQRLAILAVTLVAAALVLISVLLFLLLRSQRRHAAELRALALRDPLTGIENRRAFQQRAVALIEAARAARHPPAERHVLLLIDIDHFKRINDSHGHPQGDLVLLAIAAYLCKAVERAGHVARIGGEEFAVLCPRHGSESGLRLAERLRAGAAVLALPAELGETRITVSIGVASFDGLHCHDLSSWMRAADAALYSAKACGRDRVAASALAS